MLQNIQLWYLIQIEHYQSLSQAAEALHVSQPAISAAIKRLETQLGVKLTERTYKGLTLTPEGKQVVAEARKAFIHLDAIEAMFQQTEKEQFLLDDIILYANPSFASFLMTALSTLHRNTNSANALQIFTLQPGFENHRLLVKSKNTIILTLLPEHYQLPNNIDCSVIGKSKSYIMCSPDFPYFPPDQTSVALKDLIHVPLGIAASAFEFQTTLLNMLKEYGEPNTKIIAPDGQSLIKATQSGNIASFSNKYTIDMTQTNIRYISIRNAPAFNMCLLYNKNMSPKIVESLLDLLKPFLL